MNIIICNQKSLSSLPAWRDIRIDRSTIYGNPFDMKGDKKLRSAVCKAYRHYLWQVWRSQADSYVMPHEVASRFGVTVSPAFKRSQCHAGDLQSAIDNLARLEFEGEKFRFLCWCSPAECHGDVLLRCIEWRQNILFPF